ncbi:MAG: 50S ribosomal protein L33 [Rickettsiales bacterium]|jgi:large subunit ribosomal protein L33|nr:50S ribosomal protein L33 [Rickettsiales bacterium]
MAKKKADSIFVRMMNPETGFYYTKKKNTKSENTRGKMTMRKYDPKLRKHMEFAEKKMPSGK